MILAIFAQAFKPDHSEVLSDKQDIRSI